MTASSSTQYTFEAPELSTNHVTVYADRAEVKKVISVKLKPGVNEIVVKKLTRSIESDSIRVEGFGKAVICEVKYQEKHVKKEEDIKQDNKELNDKLNALRNEKSKIGQQLQRLEKQRNVLEGVATQIESLPSNSGDNDKKKTTGGLALIGDITLENLEKFFTFYNERAGKLDDETNEVRKRSEKLEEEINVIEKNLRDIHSDDRCMSREVSIIVKTEEPELAELHLSYLVWNASWTPSYDLRVSTKENLIQVNYYGLIQQNTNEDWNDAELSLSTAMPSVGGQVPELKTLKVGFYHHATPTARRSIGMGGAFKKQSKRLMSMGMTRMSISNVLPFDEVPYCMETEVTEVRESVISTSFDIVHPTTIPSDNTSHKVTVAIVDLKPSFQYESVPSKSPFAYLKAKVVNTSNYPFLPGLTAVFLDNNFVAKSTMKAVSPSEEFYCSLGIDPAVRVEYKPARKFHEETGLLSKSSVVTHEQKIDVKNTKADSIKIIVIDQLPLSSEEKIKVTLIEPNINRPDKGVSVKTSKLNNVEFEMIIPKNETRELLLKYSVEYPKGEQLDYKEE